MADDAETVTKRTTRTLGNLQALEMELARLLAGWLPGIVDWETKHAIAKQVWDCAEDSRRLRTRLWELRVPDPDRDALPRARGLVARLAAAANETELLAGTHLVLVRAMLEAYRDQLAITHPVYDAPSLPVLRRLVESKEAQLAWAERVVGDACEDESVQAGVTRWQRYAAEVVASAGGDAGNGPSGEDPVPPPGYQDPLPFPAARRDDRFVLAFESGPTLVPGDAESEVLYQFANYGAEMQAAETLGSTMWEVVGMPWEFYHDIARHTMDEARHARLGEARLAELGHALTDFPHSTANYAWRQLMDPLQRYCTLTLVIEADSFAYKHETYQKHVTRGDQESAQAVLFDIIDETMHVRWGRRWVPALMERYGYEASIDELVRICRDRTRRESANTLQRNLTTP